MQLRPFRVIGIGEILWDVFPDGRRLGGAPLNFAFHCAQLGAKAFPVSCVGRDPLGDEIIDSLKAFELDSSFLARREFPTGTVYVTLDEQATPSYRISEAVAWDNLRMSSSLDELAHTADAICFGSLAQRSEVSRSTIHNVLKSMRADSLKIFDINLRQHFFSPSTIHQSLAQANILKLNDEELPVLSELLMLKGSPEAQLETLIKSYNLILLAYTRGSEGSILLSKTERVECAGHPSSVVDSVGAGDSFTATLCMGLLRKLPLSEISDHANRVAAYVCSQAGATPSLPDSLCFPTR